MNRLKKSKIQNSNINLITHFLKKKFDDICIRQLIILKFKSPAQKPLPPSNYNEPQLKNVQKDTP